MNNKLNYRPDIDGLRAIAVLSVIIFHMRASWLPGGFIGVDIFFVISGYLITSIIYHEMKENKFSFEKFYLRRIKRILPVFYVVVIVTLIIGLYISTPISFYGIGNSAISALFFMSNLYFARNPGGYFESSDTYPLLHTWSLSVEEQYYLLWPAILMLFLKFGLKQKRILSITSIFIFLFFVIAEFLSVSDKFSAWSYYLLPTRAGELLIGSFLAFLHTEYDTDKLKFTNLSSILGVTLIILSLIYVNKYCVFPGINAFWSTFGAGLIIYSNPKNFINKFLALKPMVFIGLISYSLYLWHWPVLAYLRYINPFTEKDLPLGIVFLAVLVIFMLSVFSYYLIEKPTRKLKLNFRQAVKYYTILPSILILIVCIGSFITEGYKQRFEDDLFSWFNYKKTCVNKSQKICSFNINDNKKPILIYGDSHAGHFEIFFKMLEQQNSEFNFHYLIAQDCNVVSNIDTIKLKFRETCKETRTVFEENYTDYNTIIIINRLDTLFFPENKADEMKYVDYPKKINLFIKKLTDSGKKIIIVEQIPKYDSDINKKALLKKKLGINFNTQIDDNYMQANQRLKKLLSNYKNIYFLNLNEFLCPDGKCSAYDEKGIITYFDDDHLNLYGAKSLANKFLLSDKYAEFINIVKN